MTGFATAKADGEERWAVVVAVNAPVSAWLLPRSASSADGVAVPQRACERFTRDGVVFYRPRQIVLSDLVTYEYGGVLEDPWLGNVLHFYREHREQERRERSERRRARHDGGAGR